MDIVKFLAALLVIGCILWIAGLLPDHDDMERRSCEAERKVWAFDQAQQKHVCVKPGTRLDPPVR